MKKDAFFLVAAILAILALSLEVQADNPVVVLETNYGNINIELFDANAPITVDNFLSYVNSDFYDGLIFHRVIDNFMIQAGGFDSNLNYQTPGANIINESDNGLSNLRGTIAMAMSSAPDSANSQFFINDANNPSLDYQYYGPTYAGYCVFGKVLSIADLDVVNAISEVATYYDVPTGMNDVPVEPVIILGVRQYFYVNGATGDDNWDGQRPIYRDGTAGPLATIQAGIDAAGNGDTVVIADGIYKGDGNRDLNFGGKDIMVRSLNGPNNCIIDCNGLAAEAHRGFWFGSGEDANSIVNGLTIKNGYESQGGAIYCELNSTPTIMNCIIKKCQASSDGGGIYDCDGIISNCTVMECFSTGDGGGVYGCDGQITDCNIIDNLADGDGAGLSNCNANIVHCNISYNIGSGLYNCDGTFYGCTVSNNEGDGFENCQAMEISTCIVRDNYGSGFYLCDGSIGYCTISGNDSGLDDCQGTIRGCTITGNIAFNRSGGGLNNCNGQIENCMITGNYADRDGGGLYECDGQILDSTIIGNDAVWGGGLYDCQADISNSIISDNTAEYGGGMWYCSGTITNCTIANNTAVNEYAGGLSYCDADILNCIIWGNSSPQIIYGSDPNYSCVQNYTGSGTGNINTAPCFADADNQDYHIKSAYGRWDPNASQWVYDDVNSPCVDGGHPGFGWGQELWPHGARINMGAYGGTTQASMSPSTIGIIADLNGDFFVNFEDFAILAQKWYLAEPLLQADLDRKGSVDNNDLKIFADCWLIASTDSNFPLVMNEGFESGDFSKNPWQLSGTANWSVVLTNAYEGTYSAKSGIITRYNESILELTVELEYKTNTISFYYKTSCEENYDYLKFYIDGVLQNQWSGEQNWQLKTYAVTPGIEHTFKWVYDKDYISASGSDSVWIDNIQLFYDPLQ